MSEMEQDELIAAVAAELRRPVPVSADFDARVMRAVRATRPEGRIRGAVRWMAEPRQVRVSPIGAFAAAAGLAGLILLSGRALEPPADRAAVPVVAAAPSLAGNAAPISAELRGDLVQFVLSAPEASAVSLVGDFNDWDPAAMPLRPTADGAVWSVTVPLAPGRHEYAFVVDGAQWMPDPAAPPSAADDFGTPNSVVTVASNGL